MKAEEIIEEAKNNAKAYGDFFADFLEEARDDEKLANGDPWKDEDKAKRNGRPQEIINDTKITIRRTIEDYDQKRSTIKVKSTSLDTDETTTNAIQGLIYDINNDSMGESIKDLAMGDMLTCGIGAYRWETQYEDNLSFEQKIVYKPIYDKFNIYLDIMNTKEIDYSDSMWGGENLYYDIDTFEAEWPDADKKGFPDLNGQDNDGRICVSRYERIKMVNDTLVSVVNPFTQKSLNLFVSDFDTDKYRPLLNYYREYGYDESEDIFAWLTESGRILADRDVERKKVEWYLLTDSEILDKGEIGGEYIPIIPMLGPRYILEGSVYFDSQIRQAKDPVRLNNFVISNYVEAMSADTIAPWVTNYKKIKNHMNTWAHANNKPTVALPYDAVELPDGTIDASPPIKAPKGEVPAGWATLFQFTTESKERTSGLPDSAQGLQGNEVSGSALQLRTDNGLANRSIFFKKRHFSDILLGKHLEPAIPIYYDSQRLVRIADLEGRSKTAMINKEGHDQGEGEFKGKNIDIKNARFKTFITVGPSYSSLKQETTAKLAELLPYAGERYADVIFPEVVRYADISNSDALYDNCMKVAPVEIQEQEEKDANQLQTELQKAQQQIEGLTAQNEELEKVIMGEEQKVQSQQNIARLKSETDLRKETIKQSAETERERMSNRTDIKTTEIDAQAEINVQMLKMMEKLDAKIDSITTIRT
jgi:hypothetical protein